MTGSIDSTCMQAMRKLHAHLRAGKEAAVERTLPKPKAMPMLVPHDVDLDEDLEEAGRVSIACGDGHVMLCPESLGFQIKDI